jgi:DNA polymerase-3 subunit delta
MLYVLFGEDNFSLHQTFDGIKKSLGDPTTLITNTTTLDGHHMTLEQLKSVCETVPFLAEKRLVIVEGLLERFDSKGKSGPKKSSRPNSQKNEYQSMATYVSQVPDFTVLVLVDGKVENRNPLLKELSAKTTIKSFPFLKNMKLRQWTQQRIARVGGEISESALELLTRFIGSNLWIMSNEIEKLVLYTDGKRIEDEDIKTVVSYAQEANVFALVDTILESKTGIAQKLFQQLLLQGAAPAYVLVMLSRQSRIIAQVKELKEEGESDTVIQNKLNMTSGFILHKALEQANRYSWRRIKELYHRLLEADLSIKTGKYDGEFTLNILIAELCQ